MTEQFEKLSDFLLNQMKMVKIYQPVMLMELLNRQGQASVTDIAKALLNYDSAQVEYYEHITKNMVGKVLTNSRGITARDKSEYTLIGFEELNEDERIELIRICKVKIDEFLNKRGKDNNDVRKNETLYEHREIDCTFCKIPTERVIAENQLAYAVQDGFPVTEQHTLIIPKRHISDYFSLTQPERNAVYQLLERQKEKILKSDATVGGFNVGNNVGADAGQTVMHCHTHLIPRRKGDVANPRGGMRGVVPEKQAY